METATEPVNDNVETKEKKKTTVRILLADDHPIVRDGLKKLLQLEDDFEVVGEAGDGREVLEKVPRTGSRRAAARPPHAQPGRPVGAAGAAADQQAHPRHRPDGFRRQERIRAGDEAGLQRHRAEADGSRPDREEHPQGALRRNLAGFAHHGRGDAAVLHRPGSSRRRQAAAKAASAVRYRRASAKSSRWWRRATRTRKWPRRCSSASRR